MTVVSAALSEHGRRGEQTLAARVGGEDHHLKSLAMHILSVGEDPATVDYSKTPDGVDEAYIRRGIDKALAEMKARGWNARMCIVAPDADAALATFKQMLAAGEVDVILFGGGLRMPPGRVELFEALVNEARRSAPHARLAFDNDPNDGPDAVARQMKS